MEFLHICRLMSLIKGAVTLRYFCCNLRESLLSVARPKMSIPRNFSVTDTVARRRNRNRNVARRVYFRASFTWE